MLQLMPSGSSARARPSWCGLLCGLQRVPTGRQLDADTHGGFPVQSSRGGVGLAPNSTRATSFRANGGAIGVGPKNDVGELLDGRQLPATTTVAAHALAGEVGQIADGAAGNLRVLRADGGVISAVEC